MTASASIVNSGGSYQMIVNYSGSGTDADGFIVSYNWDFGDGTTATGQTGSHTYTTSGTYVVTLSVVDDQGGIGVATQSFNFVDPGLNACLISCTSDAGCPAGSICIGAPNGFCGIDPNGGSGGGTSTSTPPTLTPYVCDPSGSQLGVLNICSADIEYCEASGFWSKSATSCSTVGAFRIYPSSNTDFSCGDDVTLGPICVGPELDICPSSGQCPVSGNACTPGAAECKKVETCKNGTYPSDGTACLAGSQRILSDVIYQCVKETNAGSVGGYTATTAKTTPPMPTGLQANGEACTKPTADAPNNCQGINGCLYFSYTDSGQTTGNNSVANCVGDGNLSLNGCIYYSESSGNVNVCQEKYPTGCVYYDAGGANLVNCLPSKSFAGIPANCNVITSGNDTTVDCTNITGSQGAGCIYRSDGSIDCIHMDPTSSDASSSYAGCLYDPNPKYGINCPGVLPQTATGYDNYVQCVATNTSLGSLSGSQNACYSDGTCPSGQTCIAGTCVTSCVIGSTNACNIGQTCTTPCVPPLIWDSTTNSCIMPTWPTIPDCQNAYLKDGGGNILSVYSQLPTGTSNITMGINTTENSNCRYSNDPTAIYSAMTNFSLTGALIHETLVPSVGSLMPLPDYNNYLVRCLNTTTNIEAPACKISIKVGTPCSSNAQCTQDQFCNAQNICEVPACSGAVPAPGTILTSGTTSTNIGMTTAQNATCKYDTTYALNYSALANTFFVTGGTTHSDTVTGLSPGYFVYYAGCQNVTPNPITGVQDTSGICKIDFNVGSCSTNKDCVLGYVCSPSNTCVPATKCTTDFDCANGWSCNTATNTCVTNPYCNDPVHQTEQYCICKANPTDPSCIDNRINYCTLYPADPKCLQEPGPGIGPACNVLGIAFQGTAPGSGVGPLQNCSIWAIFLALLQWFAWIVAIFAVVYGLRGGYTYVTAAGNKARLELAKRYIIYTMIGVVVAIVSFGIIAIARSLLGI